MNLKQRLISEFEASGISKSELGRRLGVNEKQVRRLLDPVISSNLDTIDKAFKALGLTVRVEVERTKGKSQK